MEEKILVTKSSMPTYEEYCEMIKPLWESHWLTNMGKYHREFEHELPVPETYAHSPSVKHAQHPETVLIPLRVELLHFQMKLCIINCKI